MVDRLLRERPNLRDPEVRPRHWRWAACRVAMRHAVLSTLAARRIPIETVLLEDPLFQPGWPDAARPEQRALAALDALHKRSGVELAPADLDGGCDAAQWLGALYQDLQELEPGAEKTAARAPRKRSGSFYTGTALAGPTVERTLRPLVHGRDAAAILNLRVCDPAMGTGPFLIAALRFLTEELVRRTGSERRGLRRRLATKVLYGVDLDATAVDLGRWAVWLEVDDPDLPISALGEQLKAGDSLLGCPAGCADRASADRWVRDHAHTVDGGRFFHWPLEFPAVLAAGGFDAVVGNPPWETLQPSSKEFFCELDSGYGSLGTQQALRWQRERFGGDPGSERDWQRLRDDAREFSKYAKARFSHQGSGKLYTYRLFLEQAHDLLRDGGRLGMIVPSGLYTDLGSAPLRELFLDGCRWEWLFCFENRSGLFDIDSRYRFGPVILEKGGRTRSIRTAFLRTDPGDWQTASPDAIPYSVDQIRRLSPRHRALLDVRSGRDLQILDKIHGRGRPFLAELGGDLHFAQGDFNMTSDSAVFRERRVCEAEGYAPDRYGRWRKRDAIALPLYQGAMLFDLHPSAAAHAQGAGHRTRWSRTELSSVRLGPQYLVELSTYRDLPSAARSPQLVLRALSNATNERTVVVGLVNDLPCGNSLVILRPQQPDLVRTLFGAGVMSSLVYDWSMRQRMAGTNLNSFILAESVWPEVSPGVARRIAVLAARLALITPRDAPIWNAMRARGWLPEHLGWTRLLAMTHTQRQRLHCMLDALVAVLFGLDLEDLRWMLRDCNHPVERLRERGFTRNLDPKGFWRVDRQLEPGARRAALSLEAFADLRAHRDARDGDEGSEAFCEQNRGDGWVPRAATESGLLPWQACTSPGESWRACAWHSRQLSG